MELAQHTLDHTTFQPVCIKQRFKMFFFYMPVFISFSIRFSVSRVKVVRSAKERVGDGIRSPTLRVSSRLLTLKTTMP